MKLLTQWAFTSSALILIVLTVRALFRDRLSARLRYALWGVVLLRLLIPFQIELPAAASNVLPVLASNLAQDVTPRLDDTMLYAIPTKRYFVDIQPGDEPKYSRTLHSEADREYYSGGVVYDKNGITHYFFMMPAAELLMMIWKTGAGLCLLVILYSNWGFSLRLGRRRRRLEDVDAPIPVYVAEGLPSPCLFGVFRPAVYVTPEAAEDPDTLRHVLAHELTHHAHFDHLWSLLRCLALALHWYNPLVWLAVVLSKQDGELACDEGAVARLGEAERIPYGRTLVDMVAARSLRPGDLLSCSTAMTGGEKSTKRRVTQIVKKTETVKIALFAAAALVALGLVFTFAGRKDEPASPELDRFLSELEGAQSIYVGQPMISSANPPGLISDPEALARAKELLGKARGPFQLAEGVTREEFWESIRHYLSSTEYQDMEEPPTITQEDLEKLLFMGGCPIVLCPDAEYQFSEEHRYWLSGHVLLQWYPEREENAIEDLGTFSEDVYSQLAELARTNGTSQPEKPASLYVAPNEESDRVHPVTGTEEPAQTNGSRYQVDAAEYPEALEELIQLFVNDEDFLSQNAQAKNTTSEDIAAWLKGEGSEPIPPEVLIVSRDTWTLSAFGDGSLLFMDLTIPDHLIVQIQNICQSYGIEISWQQALYDLPSGQIPLGIATLYVPDGESTSP